MARTKPTWQDNHYAVVKEAAWDDLPEGWTKKSIEKFWDSLTGDRKHKIRACMKQMQDKVDDPGAFCGSLAKKLKVARAPAMQMTQQRYRMEQKPGKPQSQQKPEQKKQKRDPGKVKEFFKRLFNFPEQQDEADATWGERVSSWGRIAAAKSCGCRKPLQLSSVCVSRQLGLGVRTAASYVSFEKKGDAWFVQGVDSKGLVNDRLVQALKQHCEEKTAMLRKSMQYKKAKTFRGFNLDVIPALADEALKEIQSDPTNFWNGDNGYEYWSETLLQATGRVEDYANVLDIDTKDPEWVKAVEEGWDWDYIDSVTREIDDAVAEEMRLHTDLPGGIFLGWHESDGSFGFQYFLDEDDAEALGIYRKPEDARWYR